MANEEIEISELEFTEEVAPDNLIPIESATDTKATSLQILKDWFSSFFVDKTKDEEIGGNKTLIGSLSFKNGDNVLRMVQQADGNFVVYKDGVAIVSTSNGILQAPNNSNTITSGSVITTTNINKSSNAIGLKLGNGIIINSLIMNAQATAYTWKVPFTNADYIVVNTSCSGLKNYTRTTTTISCNDFHHGESYKPSDVMTIAIGF